ncbi:MAG: Dihydrolipoyllysine-residue acetyltransferase component of pyruvate dehydrogenase complex [Alphaproteobacteria bacterium MarineAlpha5_Bin5]|nr:MAG: Dihydrolipoyllysine-residue acetyltransferase component of pyruvate dehydrogenase complex [Alphaproteobacteria bacterium MarineAlpha5_Bin5]PPR49203.1 MAG: Dihydrolipoyllysine-residue acetyltransferase component of pyruvate dehydrogenase complex [Alphaproteobacteria bacterium MarineAlpha5_Bin4]
MAIKILMPSLSPTMKAGKINKWLIKIGDKVSSGDIIAEIETDKATMEVEAADEGTITHLIDSDSETNIPINTPIALINGVETDSIKINKTNEQVTVNKNEKNIPLNENSTIKNNENSKNQEFKIEDKLFASPLVKNLAIEKSIDLKKIKGSGPEGRIIKRDLIKLDDKNNLINENINKNNLIIDPSNIRNIIAKRTTETKQQVPHFYLTIESHVDRLISLRKKINNHNKIKISFNDLIVKAVSLAMQKNQNTNVAWENNKIVKYKTIDVAVAVALQEGLITPIVKEANLKGLNKISKEIKDLAKLAKENKLKPNQYVGGSITVSNLGMFGITEFSAIINPPQSSILAVGSIVQKPIIYENKVVAGHTLTSTLSADHRVLDGAIAGKFLKDFNNIIENPFEIWIESDDMEII